MASAASRLLRTYATQIEALRRLRNGSSQFVRVEHVHVNEVRPGGHRKRKGALACSRAVPSVFAQIDRSGREPVQEAERKKSEGSK